MHLDIKLFVFFHFYHHFVFYNFTWWKTTTEGCRFALNYFFIQKQNSDFLKYTSDWDLYDCQFEFCLFILFPLFCFSIKVINLWSLLIHPVNCGSIKVLPVSIWEQNHQSMKMSSLRTNNSIWRWLVLYYMLCHYKGVSSVEKVKIVFWSQWDQNRFKFANVELMQLAHPYRRRYQQVT